MRKAIERKLRELLEEEREKPIDIVLLDKLRLLASEKTDYFHLGPEQRNALNRFFLEVRDYGLQEIMAAQYGSSIIIDAIIILSFETGLAAGELGLLKKN